MTLLTKTVCALGALCSLSLQAKTNNKGDFTIVRAGEPKTTIVVQDLSNSSADAALLLQNFIARQSGATLPIINCAEPCCEHSCAETCCKKHAACGKEKHAACGRGHRTPSAKTITIRTVADGSIPEDGFVISCGKDGLHIEGNAKGTVSGVVRFLEDQLGIRYWAGNSCDVPLRKTIRVPEFSLQDAPAFRYRQHFSWSNADPIYKLWYAIEEPSEEFIDGLWVHTFGRILPSDRFGKDHPEWYSLINGERRPGHNSQWCLSNPEVFEACCTQLDSIFKANPGMDMISVSQNDGNDTYCQCPECRKIYEEEGAVSGAYVRFMNALAERFPDKQFSTLAYLFTVQPPKHVKPLPNVNIMLCDIDCKREVPLTDNASGQWFTEALTGWSAICDNIYLWDYGINFDNLVSPFPNFHILAPNIRLFRDNHVKMHFMQANGHLGTDFSELRAYMIHKLMWNPDADPSELMDTFLGGYYGPAGPYLRQYLDLITAELLASGKELWIYDSPITHKNGCLRPELRARYNELFDLAEAAILSDPVHLDRVRISRLTLQYSELEIARTEPCSDVDALVAALDLFESRTAQYQIPMLNERNNKPAEYCALYRSRFLPGSGSAKSLGKSVEYNILPTGRYASMPATVLTDGLYGGTTYVESWVGWEGVDGEVTIDLGEPTPITSVSADFLHQLGAWVLLPRSVTFSTSADGVSFTTLGTHEFPEDRDLKVKFVPAHVQAEVPVVARYVKMHVQTLGLCPYWHYGVGHPAWFFCDEISVN